MPQGRRSARRHAVFVLYQQDLLGLRAEQALGRADDLKLDQPVALKFLCCCAPPYSHDDTIVE